jgi:hypothetical protein
MEILSQNIFELQQKIISNIIHDIPIILANDEDSIYILVKDLTEEMNNFINTGETGSDIYELHVFSDEYEQKLIDMWNAAGFSHTYRSQKIDYMDNNSTIIKYLKVTNPQSGLSISFIPWFMAPDRPYPVFTYIFASWHYANSAQKSLRLSAIATGEVFGASSFHKSTVSRNIKAMSDILSKIHFDRPLSVIEPKIPLLESAAEISPLESVSEIMPPENRADPTSATGIIERATKLLTSCMSVETLVKECGINAGRAPTPIRGANAISYALSNIPDELSKVIIDKEPIIKGSCDTRKRPPSEHRKRMPAKKIRQNFVASERKKQIRLDFIAICRVIVIDAAVTFHRFLI